MQTLQRFLPPLLVLAAIGLVLATLLSDHSSEYGEFSLPPGGTVELPEGSVKVFADQGDEAEARGVDSHLLTAGLQLTVAPVAGGPALAKDPTTTEGSSEQLTTRSQAIGSSGAIATIDVPTAGAYRIGGGMEDGSGVTLGFGEDSFMAVVGEWKLLAALLGAAALIAIAPLPRRRSRYADAGDAAASGEVAASGDEMGETTEAGAYQPRSIEPYRG